MTASTHTSEFPGGRGRPGFSLIELLIVIVLLGVVAAIVIPNSSTSLSTDLTSVGEVVASEIDFARTLAVTYGSSYELTFSGDGSQLVLEHSGSNTALDSLPASPFSAAGDAVTQRILRLDELTSLMGGVWILGAVAVEASGDSKVTSVEFGPLGETSRAETTVIWLASGSENARRYLPIEINPVTGLATAGELTATAPAVLGSPSVVSGTRTGTVLKAG